MFVWVVSSSVGLVGSSVGLVGSSVSLLLGSSVGWVRVWDCEGSVLWLLGSVVWLLGFVLWLLGSVLWVVCVGGSGGSLINSQLFCVLVFTSRLSTLEVNPAVPLEDTPTTPGLQTLQSSQVSVTVMLPV
ncbi:hypothetical protein E0489_12430 [Thermus tengchongensis]|uniref:Uncharacterized protein n=1 Tax=Thermus tengchongensis TaxID=1214928 RepID=A0ABY2K4E1_9DEIN|nr:hypothetical protein E0489_12430 [Thermus tengchongensis]